MLDYVTPYVKEREAFGEPVAHRQSVAFMVADIAIELQAMRLLTYKAAGRVAAGKDAAREIGLARQLCASKGMQMASTAYSCSAARVRQGAPGRAVVPRPQGHRRDGRRGADLMIR